MFSLKQISHGSVPSAMAKVERYRLLNEPLEAESICHDLLDIEPENQAVRIAMVLCLTDQIANDAGAAKRALAVAQTLSDEYARLYYSALVWERKAKARYHKGGMGAGQAVHSWLTTAMELFEQAEAVRRPGDDDAILRWNACVRFLKNHPDIAPAHSEALHPIESE